jgi:hypothetical protein
VQAGRHGPAGEERLVHGDRVDPLAECPDERVPAGFRAPTRSGPGRSRAGRGWTARPGGRARAAASAADRTHDSRGCRRSSGRSASRCWRSSAAPAAPAVRRSRRASRSGRTRRAG